MSTLSQASVTPTTSWVNLAVANTALASASCLLVNETPVDYRFVSVAGGTASATAPTGPTARLKGGSSIVMNSPTLWLKAVFPSHQTVAVSLI